MQSRSTLVAALAALCMLCLAGTASAGVQATYYVSTSGSDSNPGTLAQPFLTIDKARQVVDGINGSMTGDIVVNLRGGTYRPAAALSFGSGDSGSNGYDVIYQAYRAETPVISGGRTITGWSDPDRDGIYEASATNLETRQLYVDGVRANRASFGGGLSAATKISTGYTTTNTGIQRYGNPSDIELVFSGRVGNINTPWSESRCSVSSITGTGSSSTVNIDTPCWTNLDSVKYTWAGERVGIPTNIENAFELLDQPGEWYLNRTTDVIYYKPRAGENMATATVVAPELERLLTATSLSHVQFRGITFADTTWLQPNTADGLVQHLGDYMLVGRMPSVPGPTDWTEIPGALSFTGSSYLRLEDNLLTRLGSTALVLKGGSHHNMVIANEIADTAAGGIRVGDSSDDRSVGAVENSDDTFTQNYIHDIGKDYHVTTAFFTQLVSRLDFSHNEIAHVPYSGACLCWTFGTSGTYIGDLHLDSNYIHHVLENLSTADGGPIYAVNTGVSSPRGSWNNNYVYVNEPTSGSHAVGLYNDVSSSYYDELSNVSEVGGYALWNQFQNCCVGIEARYNDMEWNYSNGTPQAGRDATNTYANNQERLATWPLDARTVMAEAGRESWYSDKNIAVRTNASASTYVNASYTANRAVDGASADGNLWQTTVTPGRPSWWKTDLGATYDLHRIDISFAHYLGNYYRVPDSIEIQTSPDDRTWTTVRTLASSDLPATNVTWDAAHYTFTLPYDARGRYVRLNMPTGSKDPTYNEMIALGEVRIYALPTNIAPSGTASASTEITTGVGYQARRANNGTVADNDLWQSHWAPTPPTWWKLTFDRERVVNRIDFSFAYYLGNYYRVPRTIEVQTSMDDSTYTTIKTIASSETPANGAAFDRRIYSFELPAGSAARYVRLNFPDGGKDPSYPGGVALGEVRLYER